MNDLVKNKKTYKGPGIYIGRPSLWGNPFSHLQGTLAQYQVPSRDAAIQAYETWIRERLQKEPGLQAELLNLHGKILICWCKPLACHGDVLLKLIEELRSPQGE